ncbi:alpha-galactosidase precursor [Lineolata rhizophorae]|uniref:Alpha-galactosidase n=1 Tax=Lineolata rhizophorae TaxID=578093 RepID=A0A6A6PE46_9PEZI|nr:alpha-galactosidase precursor [Lineolata rhizophorae]
MLRITLDVCASALLVLGVLASDNGLARVPQMGWDNWNAFGCDVSEDLLLGTAEKIVQLGLQDVGYHYVILDDCWSAGRDDNDTLVADSEKFPNGMAHVADRMHDLGLGFGMYSSAGAMTCARYAGSLGFEEKDAQTFASWGVDYLKYDNCYNEGQTGDPLTTFNRYKIMADALNATGRPILYGMCNWGEDSPWKWAQTIANSWRMSGDIFDTYNHEDVRCPCSGDEGINCALPGFHCSMANILNKVAPFVDKGNPGAWNDLDMLEIGNGGMTDTEYKLHFTMWSAIKSPLIMGNDIRSMDAPSLSILLHAPILALSQDPDSTPAYRRWRHRNAPAHGAGPNETQLWTQSLSGGDRAIFLLNLGDENATLSTSLADIFFDSGGARSDEAQMNWDVFDLWANRMSNEVAGQVVEANSTRGVNITSTYFNATEMSWADGLAANDSRLIGQWVGQMTAGMDWEVEVEPHGAMAYRLRSVGGTSRKRDEL